MKISHELLNEVRRSREYADYVLYGNDGVIKINYGKLPKQHYLPLNGDYVEGLILSQKLNEAHRSEGDYIRLEIEKQRGE